MNLLSPLPDVEAGERVATLMTKPGLRIERIVSRGQASPPGFWYDQAEAEWVLVLAGRARLRFADETQARVPRARRLARHPAASPPPGRLDRPYGPDCVASDILSIVLAAATSRKAGANTGFETAFVNRRRKAKTAKAVGGRSPSQVSHIRV